MHFCCMYTLRVFSVRVRPLVGAWQGLTHRSCARSLACTLLCLLSRSLPLRFDSSLLHPSVCTGGFANAVLLGPFTKLMGSKLERVIVNCLGWMAVAYALQVSHARVPPPPPPLSRLLLPAVELPFVLFLCAFPSRSRSRSRSCSCSCSCVGGWGFREGSTTRLLLL
jgi:hypothetical protein